VDFSIASETIQEVPSPGFSLFVNCCILRAVEEDPAAVIVMLVVEWDIPQVEMAPN
jgi:hypothetical protein